MIDSYTITRERVTWIRHGRPTTHPMQWLVIETASGDCVKVCDTKREAIAWLAAQTADA